MIKLVLSIISLMILLSCVKAENIEEKSTYACQCTFNAYILNDTNFNQNGNFEQIVTYIKSGQDDYIQGVRNGLKFKIHLVNNKFKADSINIPYDYSFQYIEGVFSDSMKNLEFNGYYQYRSNLINETYQCKLKK